MIRLRGFIRALRNQLFGINATQARMDILHSKLDLVVTSIELLQVSVQEITTQLVAHSSSSDLQAEPSSAMPALNCPTVRRHSRSGVDDGKIIDRVGFLVHSLELVNHFGCIWDMLSEGEFDVILHGDAEDAAHTEFERWGCNVVTSSEVLSSNSKYRYLVSNHPVSLGDPPMIHNLARRNIRFMYAAGKSGWNLSEWNKLYDLILCFGPYHASAFSQRTDAIVMQMGYPRFDRYFNDKCDMSLLRKSYGCDPARKTVVWLPTWKALSSVGHFEEEISSLCSTFNVVVKLHPLMVESEPERVEALRKYTYTYLITDSSDNLPLYQLADYMLFDYGGPPFAGIYADKRFILLNVPGAENDDLTGHASPDLTIRKTLISVDASERRLAELLNDEEIWLEQEQQRRRLRKVYFAPYFGFSSGVVVGALRHLDAIVDGDGR